MALLRLQDIGKIYVSEGSVAVGIRGVSLSFERGEFVAVTGKSGSGKSTLLNVISGMDSYEEGELYIEDQVTSHYLQPDWEEYREKYISFIFQDYNIIESFTVLENVELALMHIEDKKERRQRALELIDRVGLSSHLKHKGSRLSGGQKQRTVIARALAKDSPIILADEPTGNLDSKTSREIIELLREVSRDKLLIVVTHNFEQVEHCATRHIRVFDGAIESDHVISHSEAPSEAQAQSVLKSKKGLKADLGRGLLLGRSIFTAKPRLSFFICVLLLVGTLGIFVTTSFFTSDITVFDKNYMFNHIDGRLVIAKQNGKPITDAELEELARQSGAESVLHFDKLLDYAQSGGNAIAYRDDGLIRRIYAMPTYEKDYGHLSLGRYPEAPNEVVLYLPISFQPRFGKSEILIGSISLNSLSLKVVGIKYYYDNNLSPECSFTSEGFENATAAFYLLSSQDTSVALDFTAVDGKGNFSTSNINLVPSYEVQDGKIFVDVQSYRYYENQEKIKDALLTVKCFYYDRNYDYFDGKDTTLTFKKEFDRGVFTETRPDVTKNGDTVFVSISIVKELAYEVLEMSYAQATLFYENDGKAREAAEQLSALGYVAVPSDTEYEPDALDTILDVLMSVVMIFLWGLTIVFIAFFINLCSSRALSAFKGDMAIMRSMGISVRVIRIGMYARMFISLIPAFVLTAAAAIIIFTVPTLNPHFTYLYAWQYVAIAIGMVILTLRVTRKQIRKLFNESVKTALRGGSAE
ncbi:MAG: ATP-binding cassette domain-containing protein [Clostridia bacterium]|nr:ATP-binding cassette domain-containing protein [Clostridia bacterium]